MAGFRWIKSKGGQRDVIVKKQMKASATIAVGDALEFTNGKVGRVDAQTDTPLYVCVGSAATSTSTSETFVEVIPASKSQGVFEVAVTPLINDAAVVSGTTTQVVCAASAGSSSDMVGGIVWVSSAGTSVESQRIITSNSYGGGNVTIGWVEPLAAAPTTADTVRAVPFGLGTTALKLDSSNPHNAISSALGDNSGGTLQVERVDLPNKVVQVSFT